MIPKMIHFVWIDEEPPEWARQNIRRFAFLNPFHAVKVWDGPDSLPSFAWGEQYRRCRTVGQQSDLMRLAALESFGGWYFDADTIALRPVADIEARYDIGDCIFTPAFSGGNGLTIACLGANRLARAWSLIHEYIGRIDSFAGATVFANDLMGWLRENHPSTLCLGRAEEFHPPDIHALYQSVEGVTVLHGFRGEFGRKPILRGCRGSPTHALAKKKFGDNEPQHAYGNPSPREGKQGCRPNVQRPV